MSEGVKIAEVSGEQELFIIGGAEIYKLGMNLVDTLYLTEIDAEIEGDTFFPSFDKNLWQEVSRRHHPVDDRHQFAFDFVVYKKI